MCDETQKVQVHKVELLVIDHEICGSSGIKEALENGGRGLCALFLTVMGVETREIEWTDEHPLNQVDPAISKPAYQDLFKGD